MNSEVQTIRMATGSACSYASRVGGPVLLLICLFGGILEPYGPHRIAASTSVEQFSSARAMRYILALAQEPRPSGSAANEAARRYIVGQLEACGLTVTENRARIVRDAGDGNFISGEVTNIISVLKGTTHERPVLFIAHYDSVPQGPGASDNAQGVAVLLEMVRALKSARSLRRDLILLFSDGHENGLLGAEAFSHLDSSTSSIGAVVNLDARGGGGPAYMFETGPKSGWLVQQFGRVVHSPATSSLFPEIYKHMPNSTDFSIFKSRGIPGLNFATSGEEACYHNPLDNIQHVDERSVQDLGTDILAMARLLGNSTRSDFVGDDATYFLLFGKLLVYDQRWDRPLALLSVVALFVALSLGVCRGVLRIRHLLLGVAAVPLTFAMTALAGIGVWRVILIANPHYRSFLLGEVYDSRWYLCGFALIGLSGHIFLLRVLLHRVKPRELAAGGCLWCGVFAVASSLLAAGASYLFTWPTVAAASALFVVTARRNTTDRKEDQWLFAIAAIPACYFLPWLVKTAFLGFGMAAIVPTMLIVAVLCPFLDPLLTAGRGIRLPLVILGVALICLFGGVVVNKVTIQRPRQESLFYGLDRDTGNAYWGKFEPGRGDWSRRVFPGVPIRQSLLPFYPSQAEFVASRAPQIDLPGSSVDVVRDESIGPVRTVTLAIRPPAGWSDMVIYSTADKPLAVKTVTIDGSVPPVTEGAAQQFRSLTAHNVPPSGFTLQLGFPSNESLDLRISAYEPTLPAGIAGLTWQYPPTITRSQVASMFNNTTIVSQAVPLHATFTGQ
jgi:hypothetical protein